MEMYERPIVNKSAILDLDIYFVTSTYFYSIEFLSELLFNFYY